MSDYTDYAKNLMLDVLPATQYVTVHTADPGQTGVNQVSGTGRLAAVFPLAVSGARISADVLDYTIPASTTVTHIGYWDAAVAGNFLGRSTLASPPTFASEDTLRVPTHELNLNKVCV